MTADVIEAIGLYVVIPICVAAFFVALLHYGTKGDSIKCQ